MRTINKFLALFVITVLSFNIVNATTEEYKVGTLTDLLLSCTIDNSIPSNSATLNLTITYPNGSTFINNALTTAQGNGLFNYTTIFPVIGDYHTVLLCVDGATNSSVPDNIYKITPTGKSVENIGQLSTGILYFYVLLSALFLGLGYLFLNNKSIWVSYSGLFMMLIGFAFVYYDLHLSNLYATTIAYNSGAQTVTTGAFVMITKFLKLAPYLVAGIIAFSSVSLLRKAIKTNKSSDGWDNNKY